MGKFDISKLSDVKFIDYHPSIWEDSIFRTKKMLNNFSYDILFNENGGGHNKLFVFLSGSANRSKYVPPVFQRWSWVEKIPGICVFISDPSLYLGLKLSLGWYVGTESYDYTNDLIDIVKEISNCRSIKEDDIYFYGSSGGGFAALKLCAHMDSANAIVINPQISIKKYGENSKKHVKNFLDICFPTEKEKTFEKHSARVDINKINYKLLGKKLIYLQNTKDIHHYEYHYKYFMKNIRALNGYSDDDVNIILFENEKGHRGGENQEAFDKIWKFVD